MNLRVAQFSRGTIQIKMSRDLWFPTMWWSIPMKSFLFLLQKDAFLTTTYGEI